MKKKLILIVDDVEASRQLLSGLFQRNYEIMGASDGIAAQRIIVQRASDISAVLLDIDMSDLGGTAMLRWLKENAYVSIPVIAFSCSQKYQLETLQNGAWDFIVIPTDSEIIMARVENAIHHSISSDIEKHVQSSAVYREELESISRTNSGGAATYKIIGNRLELQYFSDSVPKLSGYTRQEYERAAGNDATRLIYSEDKNRFWRATAEMLRRNLPIDETYRHYHKNGTLVWVQISGVIIGEQDGYPILHVVFQQSSRMSKMHYSLIDESKEIIYACDTNNYDLLYVNRSGLDIAGKEEYSHHKCYEFLFGYSSPCSFCRMAQMKCDRFLERDFTYPLNNRIYSLRGKLTNWNGLQAHVEYISDVTEIRRAEIQNQDWIENLKSAIEDIPCGICVYRSDITGFHPLIYNQAFFDIFGYSAQHQNSILVHTGILNIHPDDFDELKQVISAAIQRDDKVNHTYRCFNDQKNSYIWINLNAAVHIQANGEKICYASYTDVTKERDTQEKLKEAGHRVEHLRVQAQEALENYQSLVNAVPGGIAQFEVKGSEIITKYFSDGLCTIIGYSKDDRAQISSENVMSMTYEPDLPILSACIKQATETNQNIDITYRILTKDDKPKWVHLRAAYTAGANGEKYYQAVFTDVNGIKEAEQELQKNQLRYSVAVKSSGINIWEYDIQKNTLSVVINSSSIKQNSYYIDNYIEATIKNGYVREDCIERFLSMYERLKKGEKEITEDIWYRTADLTGWWCERVIYTTAFDDSGKPVKAYGAGRDVTREKKAEKEFFDEISHHKAIQNDAVSSLIINLTKNSIVEVSSPFNSVRGFLKGSADNYFEETSRKISAGSSQELFRSAYNRAALLNKFSSGESAVPIEATRIFDNNTLYWVRYDAHLIQNPDTKDVIAHIYCVDITTEKVMQIIMNTVTKTDYDFFVLINGTDDSARDYGVTDGQTVFDEQKSFTAQNEAWIRKRVCSEDAERVVSECKPENVWKKIKDGSTYKFSFSIHDKDGSIRRKQIQFTYIASPRKSYLMSSIDVNDIYEAQEQSKMKLEKALAAKSEFLSNMSHDMRTPMNGILGLLNLTLDMSGLPAEAYDNLRGMQDSGKYLLGLINDTLDMSKIDSNRLILEYKTVNASDFIRDILTYVGPLAKEKGVVLNVVAEHAELDYIKTPPLRLRQIFVNIVTNAIKFTPRGGKVDMVIECYKRENGIAHDRISIKDNGIGMSKEFLPKIFEPFEQECSLIDGKNQGTGLGMSIVKKSLK